MEIFFDTLSEGFKLIKTGPMRNPGFFRGFVLSDLCVRSINLKLIFNKF